MPLGARAKESRTNFELHPISAFRASIGKRKGLHCNAR